ncbi:MAG TPA: HD domain-containing protein [Bacteroidales bacterium]|nr:HD domain-containing protein [Bacteroidales bacterium]
MENTSNINKRKIVNDPVHGFIIIPGDFIFDLLEHPYLQRLRRIKQLGLTSFVYPGAVHTRFQHALGAVFLMVQAIDNIRLKGTEITVEEAEAVTAAILLHDIGHGPFSHALEESIIPGLTHEDLSVLLMNNLNEEFGGRLDMALSIFNNTYPKKFLHQLVSGQLDMDRMDYLIRDSFFAGVAEGTIGTERIIKMLNVVNDQLVIEAKGIYSVEKFLIARRLMYWQVYFHKTVIAAENLLVQVLKRAKSMASQGLDLYTTPSLGYFLDNDFTHENIDLYCDEILENFSNLDDDDIMVSAKAWMRHSDPVLSLLSGNLIRRTLPRVRISDNPFEDEKIAELKKSATDSFNLSDSDAGYLVFTGLISNMAYNEKADTIKILYNTGEMKDLSEASDIFHLQKLMETKKKYFLCYPKVLGF